jgi:3-phytase
MRWTGQALANMIGAVTLAGCASVEALAPPLPAIDVAAVRETDPVGTERQDAADDPAIWRNPANPAASLIIGTDKRAGIYSYGLDGRRRGFYAAGAVNNVDLRDGVQLGARDIILVGASNRNSPTAPRITLLTLNPTDGSLALLGDLATGTQGEAYGFCFGRLNGATTPNAYVVTKEGAVQEFVMRMAATGPALTAARSWQVGTQPEGCVVDDRTGQLYLGEEDVGIWRIDLIATTAQSPVAFTRIGPEDGLVADVEGLALAPTGARGGYLVASSQGDNAYALFDLETGALRGRFRINGGPIDGTNDTDGIELMLGDFGPDFPGGLFVAQDGNNLPEAQNFKLLSWTAILSALGLN